MKKSIVFTMVYVSLASISQLSRVREERRLTWKPSLTVSTCRIGSSVGWCHLVGSHNIVLLKAKPGISAWNLRNLLLGSLVCHPITRVPLQIGPSNTYWLLFSTSFATVQVPNRLGNKKLAAKKRSDIWKIWKQVCVLKIISLWG